MMPKNIAGFESQVLVLGVRGVNQGLRLLRPDPEPQLGSRVY
jgi:hypothetical protein